MVSRSGHRLLDADAVATIRDELCPVADLVTPNLPELADLLQVDEATSWDDALGQGRALAARDRHQGAGQGRAPGRRGLS